MAEGMQGRFSDYTRSSDGIYDPWAVGINAAMGGYQYGMDRSAQERERQFAEQQRGRTRKDWASMDEAQKVAREIENDPQYQVPDEERYFPEAPQGQGLTANMTAAVAPSMFPAGMIPQASTQSPAGTAALQSPAQPQVPLAPPQAAAPQRREKPRDMWSPAALRLEADKYRALATRYQQIDPLLLRDHIDAYMEKGKSAYDAYTDAATAQAMSVLNRGDVAGFEQWKKSFPDLAQIETGGHSLGGYKLVGTQPRMVGGQMVKGQLVGAVPAGMNYTLANPKGETITLDEQGINEFAAEIKQNPAFWAQAGEYGAKKRDSAFDRTVKGQELATNSYNAQTNRLIALQQAEQNRLALQERIDSANASARGDYAKAMQSVQDTLFKHGETMVAQAVNGALIQNADGTYASTGGGDALTVQIVGPDGKLGPAEDARTILDAAGKQGKQKVIGLGMSALRSSVRYNDGVAQVMLSPTQAGEMGIVMTKLENQEQKGGFGVATLGDGTTVVRTNSPGGPLLWRGRMAGGKFVVNSAPIPYNYDQFSAATSGGWMPAAPPMDYMQRLTASSQPKPAKPGAPVRNGRAYAPAPGTPPPSRGGMRTQ